MVAPTLKNKDRKGKTEMHYITYNSVDDILKNAETMPSFNDDLFKYYWRKLEDGDGFHSSTEAVLKKCRGSHEKQMEISSQIIGEIKSDVFMKKRFTFVNRQMVGQRVDIPRYLSGDIRCWFACKKIRRTNRAVRVYASIGGNSGRGNKELAVNGVLASAVVEYLESNSVNVELWSVIAISEIFKKGNNPKDLTDLNLVHLLKIKDSCEYIDLGYINYLCGDNFFFRNIIFKSFYQYGNSVFPSGYVMNCSGLGRKAEFSRKALPPCSEEDKENSIIIPSFYKISDAKRWFSDFVKNINN